MVLKRDKSAGAGIKDQNNWYAVSGDPSTGAGYTLAENPSKAGAIEAAKKDLHAFTLNTSGQYQVEIQNLPGDISKYYYLLSGNARKNAEYTVAIYHTKASSIGDADSREHRPRVQRRHRRRHGELQATVRHALARHEHPESPVRAEDRYRG